LTAELPKWDSDPERKAQIDHQIASS